MSSLSSTVYVVWPNCTVTKGSSSSVILTVVSVGITALTPECGMDPNASFTLSPSSSTVSWVGVKVTVLVVSPLLKVTLVGTE